jgi:hypothetical protein
VAEAMSENPSRARLPLGSYAASWYDDAPITGEQLSGLSASVENGEQPSYSRFVVRKLLAEIDRLRADRPQLTDEYGLRIRHISTLTEERAIADTLGGALEVLAEFDARERPGVVSRKLRVREVGPWRDVEQEGERG